jgi:hypothetical protein
MNDDTEEGAPRQDYEWQSEARVRIHLPNGDLLKLTVSDAAQLYRTLGAVLRDYSAQAADVLAALGEEADLS